MDGLAPSLTPDADATLPADALPAPFADALAIVAEGGRVLLTREGKPAAFIVSVGEMADWEAFEDAHWARVADEALDDFARDGDTWPTYTVAEMAERWGIDLDDKPAP